jgi:L-glutamine-phosphate cytidylyltransferase
VRAIIIGAGRGSRLKAMTDHQPKCYATVGGRRILDWTLEAFAGAGLADTVFIGGYQIDQIRKDYPGLTYCHNADWENNNILLSLFHAEAHMESGFVCAYADILFRDTVVRAALAHPADIVLCVDTRWRERYTNRSQHPEDDAEKVIAEDDRVVRIHRQIPSAAATGEYIGVARFSARGAALLREHYQRVRREYAGRAWREAKVFEKAYLILLFQEMIEQGVAIHLVPTHGDYMEIDTEEDYALANNDWVHRFGQRQ